MSGVVKNLFYISSILLCLLGCMSDNAASSNYAPLSSLYFQDPNLSKCIRNSEAYYIQELDYLSCFNKDIHSISGIEKLTSLTHLELNSNYIIDISPISKLTNLQQLSLGINNVKDIRALSNLTNLQNLSIDHNDINDLKPLSNLKELVYLNISYNQVTDITPLYRLVKLRAFISSHNDVKIEQAYKMKELLPDCIIYYNSDKPLRYKIN
jgi:internalin A